MQLVDNQYFASCPVGFEETLADELKQQGIQGLAIARGGVHFQAQLNQAIHFIGWSRIASRVFKKLLLFNAHSEEDFFKQLEYIKWDKFSTKDQSFSFKVIFTHNKRRRCFVKNSQFASLKAKDALCDFYKNLNGERPNVDTKNPDCSYLIHIKATQKIDKASLLIDMCGEPLSHRGYRTSGFSAPLRENLAAGLIKLSGWKPSQEDLIDGMCGSGTFLIEAMMMAKNIPPSFIKLKDLEQEEKIWSFQDHIQTSISSSKILEIINFQEESEFNRSIQGFDIDSRSIRQSRIHLNDFPENQIQLEQKDFFDIEFEKETPKMILLNPPYGERMGSNIDLDEFYLNIGERLKNHAPNTTFGIICSDKKLLHKIRLKPHAKHEVFNGNLRSFFYVYQIR